MSDLTPANEGVAAAAPSSQTQTPRDQSAPRTGERRYGDGSGERRPYRPGGNRRQKKVCVFCQDKIDYIDYKDIPLISSPRRLNDRYKINPRRVTGTCAMHQRQLANAIKRARYLALLPYTGDRPPRARDTRDR